MSGYGFALCAIALGASAVAGCSNGSYIADNKELFRSIPLPAHARVLKLTSAPYYSEGGIGGDPLGYTTDAEISPRGKPTPEVLVMFYRSRLRRWHCRDAGGLGPPVLACRRGDAYVNVNLANLAATPSTYHVIVDAHHKESD